MAITYDYTIANLEYTNDDAKGVVVAHYRVDAKDAEESVGAYGTMNFVPKPDDADFTPFEQLTEETVLGWVKAELNTGEIEQALANKLNEKLNPTVVAGLPWNTDSE